MRVKTHFLLIALCLQIRNPARPPAVRASAAAYLGSFLARASFIGDATLRPALVYLLEFSQAYVELHALYEQQGVSLSSSSASDSFASRSLSSVNGRPGALPPLPPRVVFYAVMQAAFYVVCFTAGLLRERSGGVTFLASLPWGACVASPLDPLSRCLGSVAGLFCVCVPRVIISFHRIFTRPPLFVL